MLECSIIFLAILFVEVFVFNYKCYSNPGIEKDYDDTSLSLSGVSKKNATENYYVADSSAPAVTISNLGSVQVKSLYFDCDFSDSSFYEFEATVISTKANTGESETLSQSFEVVKADEQTKYLQTSFSSPSSAISIKIYQAGNGETILGSNLWIRSLSLNKRLPFNFSMIRILALAVPAYLIYLFVYLFIHRETIFHKITFQSIIRSCFYVASFGLILVLFWVFGGFENGFLQNSGSQISQELVDSFLAGRVSLSAIPSPSLVALPNPYDPSSRAGVYFLWDHLLYKGNYFSYYGVTPVFLFFLPLHVLTGQYVYDAYGVLIFSLVADIFMALSWRRLLKAFFHENEIPLFLEIGGFAILYFCSGILTNLERPYFYECATSSAFMCMMIGLFHLSSSGIFDRYEAKKQINLFYLFFASFWFGLAVLARATMALYVIAFLIWIAYFYYKNHVFFLKKDTWLYWILGLLPLFVFGIFQCVYNYLRFGNPLDFGIEYSLTIADFLHMPFSFTNVLTSLWNFFFALPRIQSDYFFLAGTNVRFGNAFYFFETGATYGLFARFPLLFGIFVSPFAKKMGWKDRIKDMLFFYFPCVIVPVILVILTWQSGYATRYYSDFAWIMVIYGLFLFFNFYLQKKSGSDSLLHEKWLAIIFISSFLFAVISNLGLVNLYTPEITQFIGTRDWTYTMRWLKAGRDLTFWR